MGRSSELFMRHQQELEERERIEHLDREAAYFAEINTPHKPGESHNPTNNANDNREQKQGVRTTP